MPRMFEAQVREAIRGELSCRSVWPSLGLCGLQSVLLPPTPSAPDGHGGRLVTLSHWLPNYSPYRVNFDRGPRIDGLLEEGPHRPHPALAPYSCYLGAGHEVGRAMWLAVKDQHRDARGVLRVSCGQYTSAVIVGPFHINRELAHYFHDCPLI